MQLRIYENSSTAGSKRAGNKRTQHKGSWQGDFIRSSARRDGETEAEVGFASCQTAPRMPPSIETRMCWLLATRNTKVKWSSTLPISLAYIDEPVRHLRLCNTCYLGKMLLFHVTWIRIVTVFSKPAK